MFSLLKNAWQLVAGKPKVSAKASENPVLKTLVNRRSCRRFTDEPVSDDTMNAILEAGRFAPSSVNLQTWSFITFTRETWQDVFGTKIPFNGNRAIMVCSDVHRIGQILTDFKTNTLLAHTMAVFNVGLAAMAMTVAAEALGLASVMLSDTGKSGLLDTRFLKDKLHLPEGVIPIATIVLGYRKTASPGIPPRFEKRDVVFESAYGPLRMKDLTAWHQQMKIGYKLTNLTSSFDNKLRYYLSRFDEAEEALQTQVFGRQKDHPEPNKKEKLDGNRKR
ncbi:MAG: hypothetical protein GXO76_05355 [Calditrichaeota bacterium]|nr:hypothetical protein [Calditrichota bacterium]